MSAPILHLSRRYTFAASHRLYADALSPEQNEAIFGKCANPNGHGHNYGLTVTVTGPVDPDTGFVMPLTELDDAVRRNVLDLYDHRYLNLDVEDYFRLVPTGENIARMVWERLSGPLAGRLERVTLDETRNNRFEYPAAGTPRSLVIPSEAQRSRGISQTTSPLRGEVAAQRRVRMNREPAP